MSEKEELKAHNQAIKKLATDLSEAINNYLKGGHINLAIIVGVLEDVKMNVIQISRQYKPAERINFKLKPPEYIG